MHNDQQLIWQSYTGTQQPVKESAMGRLFEKSAFVVKRIAHQNSVPLNKMYFDFAMQVFQAGIEFASIHQSDLNKGPAEQTA